MKVKRVRTNNKYRRQNDGDCLTMNRRAFLQTGLAGLAAAALPRLDQAEGSTEVDVSDVSPRRLELLDADWRLRVEKPVVKNGTPITDWVWTPGSPDQEDTMIDPNMDVSSQNWQKTTPGDNTLPENSYGWYRTVLPDIPGPGRTIHFDCVDDNGTVYLNGKKLIYHTGWDDPFDVSLDSAWRRGGPNVLVVLVQNVGGAGGITKPVTVGQITPEVDFSALAYDDSSWRTVHLPHDYVVEGTFDSNGDVGHGALPFNAAWYRKRFDIPKSDHGKSLWLYFEGVFRDATVYVNGKQLYFQEDGYDPFFVDIAGAVRYGGSNVLAVYMKPRSEGWWYEGGGIYRHVWLNVADPLHVAPWGVYVTSDVKNPVGSPSAELTIQTRLTNTSAVDKHITVATTIIDPNGRAVAHGQSSHVAKAGLDLDIVQQASLASASLWSLENRNLYFAETEVTSAGKVVDTFRQRFGIRALRFDPDHGFFLNEKPVKLQGTCNHQDFVGVGIAMPDSILYWRMQRLKDQLGCNAIRCSHNPMTPSMYDACDELGLLVMDETRHPGDDVAAKGNTSTPYSHTDHIEKMVRRDRNHPSVIMWSMANEEWGLQSDPYGARMLSALMDAVHKHDKTRPITTADNSGTGNGWMVGFGSVEDLLGVNYNYGDYDWLHAQYPNKPVFGSETASDVSCRGVYARDDGAAHLSSYMSPEGSWRPLGEREFVLGGFVWTGFDYRGEPTPFGWPEISSNFGLLDTCGFPKDAAFYYKAWWKQEEPLVHIFPHWNWAGKEGQNVPVWCFSNCDRVELFVNGVSEGEKDMPRFGHLQWDNVMYAPGELIAVGYRGGKQVTSMTVKTTGSPAAIRLSADRNVLVADREDTIPVTVEIVDDKGLVVPTASNRVTFSVTGAGVNAGVGNGDPSSHEPNQASFRSAFNGLCMVLVKTKSTAGAVELTATSEGLTPAGLRFTSRSV